jgi:hypothetical protein
MDPFDRIVEQRIADAAARGEFDGLPGQGAPLELDDDRLVPDDLRVAYRLLRNAGYVPEEVRLLGELGSVEQLLRQATRDDERAAASARLRLLLDRVGCSRGGSMQAQAAYFERLLAKLDRPDRGT